MMESVTPEGAADATREATSLLAPAGPAGVLSSYGER